MYVHVHTQTYIHIHTYPSNKYAKMPWSYPQCKRGARLKGFYSSNYHWSTHCSRPEVRNWDKWGTHLKHKNLLRLSASSLLACEPSARKPCYSPGSRYIYSYQQLSENWQYLPSAHRIFSCFKLWFCISPLNKQTKTKQKSVETSISLDFCRGRKRDCLHKVTESLCHFIGYLQFHAAHLNNLRIISLF